MTNSTNPTSAEMIAKRLAGIVGASHAAHCNSFLATTDRFIAQIQYADVVCGFLEPCFLFEMRTRDSDLAERLLNLIAAEGTPEVRDAEEKLREIEKRALWILFDRYEHSNLAIGKIKEIVVDAKAAIAQIEAAKKGEV